MTITSRNIIVNCQSINQKVLSCSRFRSSDCRLHDEKTVYFVMIVYIIILLYGFTACVATAPADGKVIFIVADVAVIRQNLFLLLNHNMTYPWLPVLEWSVFKETIVPVISFKFHELDENVVPFRCERMYWRFAHFLDDSNRFYLFFFSFVYS